MESSLREPRCFTKIEVKRIGDSDVLEVSYTTDDPGIVYRLF